ncbi:MAG: hypothetical protein CVU90_05885 [Firmicutes bacterium HGW-Firmicutes-15]|nr:MAG: hypothetical protein CVU90_05885 [Firmicutes bacterium HGW-Firmicutes-15]
MNKKHSWSLGMMLLLFSISFFAFHSVQNTAAPVVGIVEAQAEETGAALNTTIENGEKLNQNAEKLTINNGQAVDDKKAEIIPGSSVNNNQPMVKENKNTNIPVSRSGQPVDTYKYPELSKVNGSFGQFRYKDLSGGRIEVDPQWIAENIVTINLPGLNRNVQVNKNAADNFIKAFTYIKNGTATINGKEVPLLSLIKTMDGTFVTRHVNWNSAKGLSNHSWGTAIDINAANHFRYVNPAQEPNDPNVILWEKAFKPAGFSWGNSYSDSMHYELLK